MAGIEAAFVLVFHLRHDAQGLAEIFLMDTHQALIIARLTVIPCNQQDAALAYRDNLRRAVGSPKAFARVIQKPSLSTLSCTAKMAVLRMCVLGWPP